MNEARQRLIEVGAGNGAGAGDRAGVLMEDMSHLNRTEELVEVYK